MAQLLKPVGTSKGAQGEQSTGSKAIDIFPEYYLIEVEHFQNIIRQPIDEWVYLFKNSQVRDDFHSKNIQAAKEKLALLHMSVADRKAYEQFQVSRASAMDVLAGQYQEGMSQGMALANRENARKMRQEGLDLALIARISGLTVAEIAAL